MARLKKIFFSFFLISLLLHALFFFQVNFEIEKREHSQFSAWPKLLKQDHLLPQARPKNLPKEALLLSQQIRSSYFRRSMPLTKPNYIYLDWDLGSSYLEKEEKIEQINPFFLWPRKTGPTYAHNLAPYQALISPYGKVILLYPEKLSLNPYENIRTHNYLKKSTYFLEKNFFWTKIHIPIE